jgi:topoisomerase IA-like protein
MKPAYQILDIGFNVAVAHLADKTARGLRGADIALHTYEQVIHQIETHGIIVVWPGSFRAYNL